MKESLAKKFPPTKKIETAIQIIWNEIILILSLKKKRERNIADLLLWQTRPPYTGKFGIITSDLKFKSLAIRLELEGKKCLSTREMWNIYNSVIKLKDIDGDIAEVGVYKGGSAKLISEVKDEKKLYLFDTFEGIPGNNFDVNKINSKILVGSLTEVESYLSNYKNLLFYPGIFPESASSLIKENLKFSFVHLDTDIYEATFDSLVFFYPLMSKGGVILTHDYSSNHLPGVKKAFDEFFKNKPETILIASACGSTQAFVVII